jgi:hypothetical protein
MNPGQEKGVPSKCESCGATYADANDSCSARFEQLLALDHSRREPWGSRHGLAFAAFALQHPARFDRATVHRSRELVERVIVGGEPLDRVVRGLRGRPSTLEGGPGEPLGGHYVVTIADPGEFDATTYVRDLERWCLAALTPKGREL